MKKKIMAFLLAATMVVGCATTASANGDFAKITAVKADQFTAGSAKFAVNKYWNFIQDTNTNGFAAAWSNQKDDTSKGLVEAWRTGWTQAGLTANEYHWSTNYAFGGNILNLDPNENKINNDYNYEMYGSYVTATWDNSKIYATNAAYVGDTDGKGESFNYYITNPNNGKSLFATTRDGAAYEIRSGYAVVLQSTVDTIKTQFEDERVTEQAKADSAFLNMGTGANGRSGYFTTGTLPVYKNATTNTPWAVGDIVAFVKLAGREVKAAEGYGRVNLNTVRTTVGNVYIDEKVSAVDDCYDLFIGTMKKSDNTEDGAMHVYAYDEVSPYEALELKNITNYNNAYVPSYDVYNMAQANDLYEVMSDKTSFYDKTLNNKFWTGTCATHGKNNGLPDNNKQFRVWRWRDVYSRDLWTARNAQWDEAQKAVLAKWYESITPGIIKAYNAATGEDKLNDDAKINDVIYMDIVKTSGDAQTYTLVQGKAAKTVSDKAVSVKALHWTGNGWEQVPASMVKIPDEQDADCYGVMLTSNKYSPYILIEVVNEGTGADATAEAAKTPEKSGKTGVSFLGL